ncbi:cytochrome P450 1A1-like [Mytilus californianus]|uniref:cytochrome P450 1A1-like n=1 Tax=Mytilus californianus TaxID=6549 RepID=UPI002246048F|nr:cytochrome P450 1A1-like [Mytilus californianus]
MKTNFTSFDNIDLKLCIAIFSAILLITGILKKIWEIRKLPPGPWGYPFIGHLTLLGKNPAETFSKMAIQYGDIFFIRMGKWPTIVLNSKEAIDEALTRMPEIFSDRPKFYSINAIHKMKGLVFGEYSQRLRLHRKIASGVLQEFATSKSAPTEYLVRKESDILIQTWMQSQDNEFNPIHDIEMAVGAVIYQLLFGSDINCHSDQTFIDMVKNLKTINEGASAGNFVNMLPWIRFIMPSKVKQLLERLELNKKFAEKCISESLPSYDKNHERGMVDGLITAANKYAEKEVHRDGITRGQIYSTIRDFIGAGIDTTSITLQWTILLLSIHTNVQEKMQHEIDDILGGRKATLQDQGRLPYVEATILEVMRHGTVAPLNIPHSTSSDVKLRNYEIKKGTVVFCNIYGIFKDQNIWIDPNTFRPERFLSKNNTIIHERADIIATQFGVGRRRCIGDTLSKRELFLFITSIYQALDTNLRSDPSYGRIINLNCKPTPYKIQVNQRY